MVMIVLLNDAWICAMPSEMFFLIFLRVRVTVLVGACAIRFSYVLKSGSGTSPPVYFAAGFAAGAAALAPRDAVAWRAFLGPLRVRALVRVRCPRTGNPLRWR